MEFDESRLVLNPEVQIKHVREGGSITALTVRAPVKGESMRVTKIARSTDPQMFTALLIHSGMETLGTANFTDAERTRLTEMGVLLAQEHVSAPVYFSCDLNNPPIDLIPARGRRTARPLEDVSDLIVNSTLRHLGTEGPTPAMRGHVKLSNAFRTDRSWISIDDPATGTPCLYSYPQEIANDVEALRPGEPLHRILSAELNAGFYSTGVTESSAKAARERDRCRRERSTARAVLEKQRYVVLPHMLAPIQLAAIRRYYQTLIAEGFLPFGDEEWPNRFFAGRDPIGYFFHEQLKSLVSDIAGQPVKASFSFFASYHPGSAVPPHRDREQCEWALSLHLDQSPEADTLAWPLYLQPPGAD
ncbi:MAG: hypothetical protein ACMG6H_13580, partial [Acidobacteriota bacterium]